MTSRVITANIDDGPKDLASLFAKYRFRGIPAFTLACAATLFKAGINVEEASQAALALGTAGLFNASVFAAAILPLLMA